MRKINSYNISPSIEVIKWEGEKGKDIEGRIAFLPQNFSTKEFWGEKASLILCGKGYRDPYTGSVIKKGYVIALPLEMISNVKIISASPYLFLTKEKKITIRMPVSYQVKYKNKIIENDVYYSKTFEIEKLKNKNVKEFLSGAFGIPKNKIQARKTVTEEEYRDGYKKHKVIVSIENEKFIVKEEEYEDLRYAPLSVLLEKIPCLECEVIIQFQERPYNEYLLNPHISKEIIISPRKPIFSYYDFLIEPEKFLQLKKREKIKTHEITVKSKIENKEEMSFDEFLSELKDCEIKEIKEEIKEKEERLKEIEKYMHYYAYIPKTKIIKKFSHFYDVKETKKVIDSLPENIWVKIREDVGCDINYIDADYYVSIIIPHQKIDLHFFYYSDKYGTKKGGESEIKIAETTEKDLKEQEKKRENETKNLKKEIEELEKKLNEIKQKNPRKVYKNIVNFLS